MAEQHAVDITELATLGEQFPLRLMQLGFRLMQGIDAAGRDQYRYVLPPVCAVPAGPFLMGSDEDGDELAADDELPQHTVTLSAYEIACYPLTVAEYACFVQATNRAAPSTWTDQQQHPDHPVVYVSWDDVLAYSQWLALMTGKDWRLPTESEWEKAARGTDGRIYPWGDQWDKTRANTFDGGPGTRTPVGSYPGGASPYGAHDMAGNVYEWTSTTLQPYLYQASDGRKDLRVKAVTILSSGPWGKVLRGGSWSNPPRFVRAACRYDNLSTDTSGNFGVRLVRVGVAG